MAKNGVKPIRMDNGRRREINPSTEYILPEYLGDGTRTGAKFLRDDGQWSAPPTAGITDGTYGDIVVTGGGTNWSFDPTADFSANSVTASGAVEGGSITANGETAERIAIFDAAKKVSSANTATYPNLTELSYLKGVTSSVQEQLDNKQIAGTYASGDGTATGINTGDQTSIVGISGTKAQYNTSCSDGNFLFEGDQPALSYASAFATGTTTVNTATYLDITGCSVSLAAGTWIIFAHVVGAFPAAIIQMFCAITHSDNTVIAESAQSRPASGTASLNSPMSCSFSAIVTPASTTTYKLRAARGVTTHTGSWTVYDGSGYNTTNHATNNSDKGTSIIAIRIA